MATLFASVQTLWDVLFFEFLGGSWGHFQTFKNVLGIFRILIKLVKN